jgi:hypothetical protein
MNKNIIGYLLFGLLIVAVIGRIFGPFTPIWVDSIILLSVVAFFILVKVKN